MELGVGMMPTMKFIVPVFAHSSMGDVIYNSINTGTKASSILKRLLSEKTVEVAHQTATYTNLIATHNRLKESLNTKFFGTRRKPSRTFARCDTPRDVFHLRRRVKINQAHTLHRVVFTLTKDFKPALAGNVPEVPMFSKYAYEHGDPKAINAVSFRMFESFISVNEWYKKGIEIKALGGKSIRPLYGVWSSTSQEYLELLHTYLQQEKLSGSAIDLGCGTGVLGLILADNDLEVTAIDNNPTAAKCARFNSLALGLDLEVLEGDITQNLDLPKYDVIICNPPWIPVKQSSPLDSAVYDEEGKMLTGAFKFAKNHLSPGGRFLLVHSDLAGLLELQPTGYIHQLAEEAGFTIKDMIPGSFHKSLDTRDPLKPYKDAASIFLYDLRRD